MKSLITLLATALTMQAVAQPEYHRDLTVTELNREAPRTEFVTYASRKAALTHRFDRSDSYLSLDGTWRFYYADDLRQLPADATSADADLTAWETIRVPGNWELQGHGTPIYVNTRYEFAPANPAPPQLPEVIPGGVYRRDFTVPDHWLHRNIYLTVGGAKSGLYLYVNGRFVGYSEDSKSPAQFRIDRYLRTGRNTLAIKLTRWSTGSYLEAQDFWRLSGIERSVYLTAEEESSLHDFEVVSTLDEGLTTGLFTLRMLFEGGRSVEAGYELIDASGRTVASGTQQTQDEAVFHAEIRNVARWSAETPQLYTLLMQVKGGERTSYIPFKVGFRRIEFGESGHCEARNKPYRVLLVNGQPVKFKGVNLHEHDPRTGHYVSEELLLRDLRLMKAHNINAIRTSHYPQQRRFYELCDSLGFYVYSEANVESHGMGYNLATGHTLGNDRAWWPVHEDRIGNMYLRCRNYPSVTLFSPGNEAGNGYNFYKAYEWLEAREKGEGRMNRPICYERAEWQWNTDLFVPMYPSASALERWGREGTDRPVIPCEYSHAMGNSNGSLWLQWQSIYKYPNLQGGFIWDWVDQGLSARDASGSRYWAYGGDYGDREPSDGNFCCNGIVSPDRTPHPAMAEVRYAYADIAFHRSGVTQGDFEVENRFYFKSLADYEIRYRIEVDGVVATSGKLQLRTAPQQRERFSVPLGKFQPGRNYYLRLQAVTRHAMQGIPAGTVVAEEQFALQRGNRPDFRRSGTKLTVAPRGDRIEASNGEVRLSVNRSTGLLESYRIGHTELLIDGFGLRPNFWRAPTDNDYGNGMPQRTLVWKEATRGTEATVTSRMSGENAEITALYHLTGGNLLTMVYTLYPSGALNVRMLFRAGSEQMPEMPRYGVRFRLPEHCDSFSYFGRGPGENYADRKAGTFIGRYESSARDECFPYVRPQETGHHCDTEWIDFGNLLVVADRSMEFNALRCSIEDLDGEEAIGHDYQWRNSTKDEPHELTQARNRLRRQTHINDVPVRHYVEVCLDYAQTGVGGYDSWGSLPEESVTVRAERLRDWSFTLVPTPARKN